MRIGLTCLVIFAFAACSKQQENIDGNQVGDAAPSRDLTGSAKDLAGPPPPQFQYATNTVTLPTSMNSFAIDIDGGGRPENQLKSIVSAITVAGFDLQGPLNMAVAAGQMVLLMDIGTTDLLNACGTLKVGITSPSPSPPKFDGTDQFTFDPNQPPAALSECDAAGTLSTILPKDLKGAQVQTLQIALPLGGATLPLAVYGAHVQGQVTTNGIMSGQIHGVIRETDINSQVIPALATLLTNEVRTDPAVATTIIDLFVNDPTQLAACQANPATCTITAMEVQSNSLIQNVLAPDVQAFSNGQWMPVPNGTMKDSLSLGIGFTAVRANQ